MTFTVEDGTGLEDANSYVSVADADAYFTDRRRTTWVGTDDVKKAALVNASDYVDIHWEAKLKFPRLTTTQAKAFPWADNDLVNPMPVELIRATCEYALRNLSGTPLLSDQDVTDAGQVIKRKRERLIQLEEEIHYETHPSVFRSYPAADLLMQRLCKQGQVIRN